MKKYSMETVVGIFVVIGLLLVGYMTVKLGKVSLFGDDYYSTLCTFWVSIWIAGRQPH